MREKVTAVFDLGKTNKKFFLFDADFQEVYREYIRFDPVMDEDGYPSENLKKLEEWLEKVFDNVLFLDKYDIVRVNFSTYGASLVHLDENGEVLTPLYCYTKDLPQEIIHSFYEKYGPESDFVSSTGSPSSGMLNSGLQLYWLKYSKPEIFKKIKYSLHLPQYISYLFTGIAVSEYTSIGCHTALWDYNKKDYHDWVYQEEIHRILPGIVPSATSYDIDYKGKRLRIGVGIHDSSAALLPYIRSMRDKFILVSTGTWSVAMNPFSKDKRIGSKTEKNHINYMRINGEAVKASRLFLGNEYKEQVKVLARHYGVPQEHHKMIRFDSKIYFEISQNLQYMFKWTGIRSENMPRQTRLPYDTYIYAYHQLMLELVLLQVESIRAVGQNEGITQLFIDGGFSDNEVYIQLLAYYLGDMSLNTTDSSLGSALGAAICVSDIALESNFLKKNYSLRRYMPFTLQ